MRNSHNSQPTNQKNKKNSQPTKKKSANQPKNEENMKKYQRNLYLKLLERRQIGSVLILKEIFDHLLPHTHTIMKTTIFATFWSISESSERKCYTFKWSHLSWSSGPPPLGLKEHWNKRQFLAGFFTISYIMFIWCINTNGVLWTITYGWLMITVDTILKDTSILEQWLCIL